MTDQPTTQNVRPEELPYFERQPLITRPRKHYHYPSETEEELRAKRRRARGEQIGGTSLHGEVTDDDRAQARALGRRVAETALAPQP